MAMKFQDLEVCQRACFLGDYLRSPTLRNEIHEPASPNTLQFVCATVATLAQVYWAKCHGVESTLARLRRHEQQLLLRGALPHV